MMYHSPREIRVSRLHCASENIHVLNHGFWGPGSVKYSNDEVGPRLRKTRTFTQMFENCRVKFLVSLRHGLSCLFRIWEIRSDNSWQCLIHFYGGLRTNFFYDLSPHPFSPSMDYIVNSMTCQPNMYFHHGFISYSTLLKVDFMIDSSK